MVDTADGVCVCVCVCVCVQSHQERMGCVCVCSHIRKEWGVCVCVCVRVVTSGKNDLKENIAHRNKFQPLPNPHSWHTYPLVGKVAVLCPAEARPRREC